MTETGTMTCVAAGFSRLAPVLLLLAAMANPAVGTPRPLDSLRLVVSIQWLSEDSAAVEAPDADQAARAPAPAAGHLSPFGAPDSHARSSALPRSTFQRPPPHPAIFRG